jgi:hypothetical protein
VIPINLVILKCEVFFNRVFKIEFKFVCILSVFYVKQCERSSRWRKVKNKKEAVLVFQGLAGYLHSYGICNT